MKVLEYLLDDGSSPYQKWFDSLDAQAAAKITTAKARMERGLTSSIEWFDGIGEYKIDWGPGYRIYLAQDGVNLIILFGGGTKQRQNEDIEKARDLYLAYKKRKELIKAEEAALKAADEKKEPKKAKKTFNGKKRKR